MPVTYLTPSNTSFSTLEALSLWHQVTLGGVRSAQHDLSSRQTAILLSVYLLPAPHTVKTLSQYLNVSKPAICRALDTLSRRGLAKRKYDERDKRLVLIQRTVKGSVYLSELAESITQALHSIRVAPATSAPHAKAA